MTLQELSESYAYSAELLSRRLAQLRQEEREERDESQRFRLRRLRRRLPDAMAELTPRQRQMVDMQFQEELTVTEIARRLGVNKSTVSRCLRRARQRLYSRLRFTL